MKKQKAFVIVNPTAGGGQSRNRWPAIAEELKKHLGSFDSEESMGLGHAETLAEDACQSGNYSLIVSVGGDGTLHEVVNGMCRSQTRPLPTLGVLSVGTGSDFVKTLGLPRSLTEQIRILARNKTRAVDLGRIEYQGREKTEERVFINIADAGLGYEVVRRLPRARSLVGKKLAYLFATLESYRKWSPKTIKVTTSPSSNAAWPEKPLAVIVANGRFFGGGMPISPTSDLFDGCLDLITIDSLKPFEIPSVLSLLYLKKLSLLGKVRHERVRRVTLSSEEDVGLDVDGEPLGKLPATFEILPKALEIKIP